MSETKQENKNINNPGSPNPSEVKCRKKGCKCTGFVGTNNNNCGRDGCGHASQSHIF